MTDRLRVAVIGAGHISRQHLSCLQKLPVAETVGVCDLSPAMAESAAEQFGVSRWFTDHREMLDAVRPDVVHVGTPPRSHYALGRDALEAVAAGEGEDDPEFDNDAMAVEVLGLMAAMLKGSRGNQESIASSGGLGLFAYLLQQRSARVRQRPSFLMKPHTGP